MSEPSRHSSRNDSSSTSNSPPLLTLLWEWDWSLVSVFSSLYSSIGITTFITSAAPSHFLSWCSSDVIPLFAPLFNSLSPSLSFSLFFFSPLSCCLSELAGDKVICGCSELTFLLHSLRLPLSLPHKLFFLSGSCYSSNRPSSSPPRKWG